jgi:hypothetical protein
MKSLAEDKAPSREEMIAEGVKVFKTSKRLEKAIIKAESALQKAKTAGKLGEEELAKTAGIIKRMKMAKVEFAKVEETYSTGMDKKASLQKFKILKSKYSDIYKQIFSMKKILITAGVFTALGGAAFGLWYAVAPHNAYEKLMYSLGFRNPAQDMLDSTGLSKFFDGAKDITGKAFTGLESEINKVFGEVKGQELRSKDAAYSPHSFESDLNKFKNDRAPGKIEGGFKGFN